MSAPSTIAAFTNAATARPRSTTSFHLGYTERQPSPADKPCCVPDNPRGGDLDGSLDRHQPQFAIPRKVIKGGSHLCADSYCRRYRPAARRPQMVDTGMSHIGFRCVLRPG